MRATGSGDGCGDSWPHCEKLGAEKLAAGVASKTIIELTHRATSGLVWLGSLLLWLRARRLFLPGHHLRTLAGLGFLWMCTEALIGAGLVLFRMVADNESLARGAWVIAHLGNTFLLLATQMLLVLWAARPEALQRPRLRGVPLVVSACMLVALLVVAASGAIAALGDTLFPAPSLQAGFAADFSPASHLFVRLRAWHPMAAVLTALLVVTLTWSTYLVQRRQNHKNLWVPAPPPTDPKVTSIQSLSRARSWSQTRLLGHTIGLSCLVGAQIVLGFVQVFLLVPIALQLVHLFVADLVWLSCVAWTQVLATHTYERVVAQSRHRIEEQDGGRLAAVAL